MSIDWQKVDKIEIDLINLSLTLQTKEGYAMAKSSYGSLDEVMENASKSNAMMNKLKDINLIIY